MSIQICNGLIYQPDFQFHPGNLTLEGSKIAEYSSYSSVALSSDKTHTTDTTLDARGCYVIPGLIDIHFHGCAGADFCDGTPDTLNRITHYEALQGITGICPASMTLPENVLLQIMQNAADFYDQQQAEAKHSQSQAHSHASDIWLSRADFLGIHLEGPFLSPMKCGAQNPAFLQKPDSALFRRLQQQAKGLIRIVDMAPEEDADGSFISTISREHAQKCRISIAHTAADYDTCMTAFSKGASHVTHVFHAMNRFHHREPGLIGAAYDTPACEVELICDSIHATPSAVRMAFQLFTAERIVLISDSMRATGMPDGTYSLGGQRVTVSGRLATLDSGTLAGSVTNLMDCMRLAVSFGIPLESAVRCVTANPARSIYADDRYGYLKPGYIANVVILNPDLSLRHVILRGKLLF